MSWTTYKATLTTYLNGLGYYEMPNDMRPDQEPSSKQNKNYAFTFIEPDTAGITNGGNIQSHGIRLEVIYTFKRGVANTNRDTIYDSWVALVQGLVALSGWAGEISPPVFERYQDGNFYKGTYEFNFGYELC